MANTQQQPKPWWLAFPLTQLFGINNEQGVDVGTPFHTAITAPYGGKVTRTGCYAYGCEVDILANVPGLGAVEEYVIHLDTLAVQAGQSIGAGTFLGLSGGETQQQVNGGLFKGAQHPVQNGKVIYSTGPHSEIGFFHGTPFASQNAGNPWPFLENLTGTGGAGGSSGGCDQLNYYICLAKCNGNQACMQGCLTQYPACNSTAPSGVPDIGAGIASGFTALGNEALSSLGFTSFKDAIWRTALVLIGIFLLLFGLVTLFRKQVEEGAGTVAGAAAKAG